MNARTSVVILVLLSACSCKLKDHDNEHGVNSASSNINKSAPVVNKKFIAPYDATELSFSLDEEPLSVRTLYGDGSYSLLKNKSGLKTKYLFRSGNIMTKDDVINALGFNGDNSISYYKIFSDCAILKTHVQSAVNGYDSTLKLLVFNRYGTINVLGLVDAFTSQSNVLELENYGEQRYSFSTINGSSRCAEKHMGKAPDFTLYKRNSETKSANINDEGFALASVNGCVVSLMPDSTDYSVITCKGNIRHKKRNGGITAISMDFSDSCDSETRNIQGKVLLAQNSFKATEYSKSSARYRKVLPNIALIEIKANNKSDSTWYVLGFVSRNDIDSWKFTFDSLGNLYKQYLGKAVIKKIDH